jgi:serine/threonine-protein kinase
MIGTRLGPYELIEELGKGGMATVYRAYQPNTDRYVAVKVIHRAIASDAAGLERFQREAKLVTRLEHPHLLPIYDYNGSHDPPYIVMRYLEGGTLKDILDQGPLPPDEIIYMMRQIAAALDYAHRKGVVHRDIKPSNILVDPDGNAFLTDFGIARVTEGNAQGLTRSGYTVGTPAYMSPEQASGADNVDGRSDIYALGVMLFQLLTGQMPFSADAPMAVLLKHINDPVPPASSSNTELSAAVDQVFYKVMAKKPEERYTAATVFINVLAEALNSALIITPHALRSATVKTVETQALARAKDEARIQQTMTEFEASRPAFLASQTPPVQTRLNLDDSPTIKQPSAPDVKAATSTLGSTEKLPSPPNRLPWLIVAGLVAVIALGAGAFFLFQPGGLLSPTATPPPTSTTEPTIAALEPTVTVATQPPTDSAAAVLPTVTEPPPTGTPTAVATDTPAVTPSATHTLTATPSHTPTSTSTITPSPTSTLTATPSDTPSATPTVTPSLTPTATATPTPATPVAEALRSLVALAGPGISYPVVANVPADQRLDIIGVSTDADWYQILLPDGQVAWVRASFVEAAGDILGVPVALAPTNTPTETLTPTPSSTATSTPTPTLTPSATETPAPTATPTWTPTPSITPSLTATPTRTELPGDTATPPPPPPTPTPIPAGRLPFVADFEAGPASIADWDYDPATWQVVAEGGENVLLGLGNIRNPATMLGLEPAPEWLTDTQGNLVFNLSFNLPGTASIARVLFRCTGPRCAGGYQVLELLSGSVSVRRNAGTPDIFNREGERVLDISRAPIEANRWHEVTLWAQGNRLFVYVDRQFILSQEDLGIPSLAGGAIILQTITTPAQPVRFDNLIVQRPEPASEPFEGSGRPALWQTSNPSGTTIERENNGNRFLQLRGEAELIPQMRPIRDINFSCRVNVQEGDYRLYLRDSTSGSLELTFTAGNLIIRVLDGAGQVLEERQEANFFNRLRWEDLNIRYIGDNLTIYRDGVPRFEEDVPGLSGAGGVRFTNRARDMLQLDDCLITETAQSSNAAARFALDLQQQVLARNFADFRSDFVEFFDDPFRTDEWWVDGTAAAGTFEDDPASATNQRFLRISGSGPETYRLLRDNLGRGMFARPGDRFSTDLYLTVDVRFPDGEGTGSLGIRAAPSLSGASLEGYFLDVRQERDGTTTVTVRQTGAGGGTLYTGALPGGSPPEWINLTIISFEDRLAFFANGLFVFALSDADYLGGTVALGTLDGSVADFDTLVMRDTTPLGG